MRRLIVALAALILTPFTFAQSTPNIGLNLSNTGSQLNMIKIDKYLAPCSATLGCSSVPASTAPSQSLVSAAAGSYALQSNYALNVSPFLLPHWTACAAKVKINTGYCRVFAVGDSTTYGLGSNGTLSTGDITTSAYPTRLAQFLNTTILPANRDSFMGAGSGTGGQGPCTGNDARISCGSWVPTASFSTGGNIFQTTAAATLTFTPTGTFDTVVLWYIGSSSLGGTGSVQIDSGTATNFVETIPTNIKSMSITGALGTHTVSVKWVSGTVAIVGVETYNSALGSVRLSNAGVSGVTSSFYANSGNQWAPQTAIVTQAPDLVIVDLGINDWNTAVSVAAYTANMQSIITAWKANSDVVLVTPAPSAITLVPLATQQLYINAMYALAQANSIPIIDNFSRWASYERANVAPLGFYFNTLHPDALGYSDFAQSIAQQLLSVVGH